MGPAMTNNEMSVFDKGFVGLVEQMGGDRGVVQAARVCYRSDGLSDPVKDRKLIRYLLEHDHGTPFEHSVLKFHVKAPIFVARQWFRHRMASYNEVSGRYAEVKDEFYYPEKWRGQDQVNKQGSIPLHDEQAGTDVLVNHCIESMSRYRVLLANGVAKEMARMVLPVNLYTEFYWTVNARSLMHFIKLRSEAHAQWEIRQYSNALWPLFAQSMPWTAEAFLGTLSLSRYQALDGIAGPSLASIPGALGENHVAV